MPQTDSATMCAFCQQLALVSHGERPHPYLQLQEMLSPKDYSSIRMHRYQCTKCQTDWLRLTGHLGVNLEFRPLAWGNKRMHLSQRDQALPNNS